MAVPERSWFLNQKPNPLARMRLFCLPYAGGGASLFRAWQAKLAPDVEIWPIQLPGRENRISEAPFDQMAPLIEQLSAQIKPYLDKPFAFFGFSVGALISFELSHALRQLYDRGPVQLWVTSHRGPSIPHRQPLIHALSDSEFISAVAHYNGTPQAVLENAELLNLLVPTIRADFAIWERYRYTQRPALACPIAAFGGLKDPGVTRDDLMTWGQETAAPFRLRMFPGDHFFFNNQSLFWETIYAEIRQSALDLRSKPFLSKINQ